jgi:hypothetical protein
MSEKNRQFIKNQSPDDLNDYIRVTNPGIWLLIVAILSILIGTLCWGIFGHVDQTTSATVYVKNHTVTCTVDNLSQVKDGMQVKYSNTQGTISQIKNTYCVIDAKDEIKNGKYEGELILQSVSPISFLLD